VRAKRRKKREPEPEDLEEMEPEDLPANAIDLMDLLYDIDALANLSDAAPDPAKDYALAVAQLRRLACFCPDHAIRKASAETLLQELKPKAPSGGATEVEAFVAKLRHVINRATQPEELESGGDAIELEVETHGAVPASWPGKEEEEDGP